jgi:hypothetical protein
MPVPGTACAAASEEYKTRNAKIIESLKAAFEEARDYHYAGILIVIQVNVFTPIEPADGVLYDLQ